MNEVPTVNAWRRIAPLTAIAVMDPFKERILMPQPDGRVESVEWPLTMSIFS